jgi:hypothetical protein
MKRARAVEIEGFEGENKVRLKWKRNISVELVDLPNNILCVIMQKTSLLERHVLRFASKKLHHLAHSISKSLLTKFHYPRGLHALAVKYSNAPVFEWVTFTFKEAISFKQATSIKVWYNAAKYGNIELMKRVKERGYP